MTIDEYVAEVRALAVAEGMVTDERFWASRHWHERFANGLSPADAWDEERHPALRAL